MSCEHLDWTGHPLSLWAQALRLQIESSFLCEFLPFLVTDVPFHVARFCKPSIFLSSPPNPLISSKWCHWMKCWKVHLWVCMWVANGKWKVQQKYWRIRSWVKNTFTQSSNTCILIYLLENQNLSKWSHEKEKKWKFHGKVCLGRGSKMFQRTVEAGFFRAIWI